MGPRLASRAHCRAEGDAHRREPARTWDQRLHAMPRRKRSAANGKGGAQGRSTCEGGGSLQNADCSRRSLRCTWMVPLSSRPWIPCLGTQSCLQTSGPCLRPGERGSHLADSHLLRLCPAWKETGGAAVRAAFCPAETGGGDHPPCASRRNQEATSEQWRPDLTTAA